MFDVYHTLDKYGIILISSLRVVSNLSKLAFKTEDDSWVVDTAMLSIKNLVIFLTCTLFTQDH